MARMIIPPVSMSKPARSVERFQVIADDELMSIVEGIFLFNHKTELKAIFLIKF